MSGINLCMLADIEKRFPIFFLIFTHYCSDLIFLMFHALLSDYILLVSRGYLPQIHDSRTNVLNSFRLFVSYTPLFRLPHIYLSLSLFCYLFFFLSSIPSTGVDSIHFISQIWTWQTIISLQSSFCDSGCVALCLC